MKKNRLTAYILLLIVSAIWGVAAPVIKYTLDYIPPFIFLSYRFFLSALLSSVWILFNRREVNNPKLDLNLAVLYSLLSYPLSLGFLFYGLNMTSSLSASILSITGPLFIMVLGALLLKDHITRAEIAGTVIVLIGASLIVFWSDGAANDGLGSMSGNIMILISFIFDGIAAVVAKIMSKKDASMSAVSHISFLVAFIALLPILTFNHSPERIFETVINAPIQAHIGVLYMALLSGTLAYTLRNIAVGMVEVSETAIFYYLHPVWAFPVSILWLGEKMSPATAVGTAIIIAGVVVSEYNRRSQARKAVKRRI